MLDKRFLADERLSWRAKGILAYLLSKPNDWRTREKDLINRAVEGRDAVRAAMKELEACGYLLKEQPRSGAGTFAPNEYIIVESPTESAPFTENPATVKPSTAKPATVNPTHTKNDSTENEPTKNEVTKKEASFSKPDALLELYNAEKPPAWSRCTSLNPKRKRQIEALYREHVELTLQTFRAALAYSRTSEWWSQKDMTIDTLLVTGRVTEFAEKAANVAAFMPEADRRILTTAQQMLAALGGDDAQ